MLLLSMLHMLYSTSLEENPASYKFIIEERTVFIISSENHRHYFFGSYTKAVVFNFLKVCCKTESPTTVIQKHFALSYTICTLYKPVITSL